jgi:UDP-glucose 4-epimerase
MKVFITGGAGFIGSHLCDALVAEGKEVTILDNLSTGSEKNIAHLEGKIKIFQGDIRDQKLVESLVENCDLVLHMAAALGVNNILENPIDAISTNFHGSEIVLNAAVKFDKRIIIASTSEIYGKNINQPLSEDDDRVVGPPQKIRWTYSDAKALEESIAYSLFLSVNLKVTILRFFNTVGPRQTGRYGMVVPRFVEAAIKNEPILVYGNGEQSRVFCHVSDAISAIMLCAKNDVTIGQVYNVGGKGEISINELALLIKSQVKSKSEIKHILYEQAYKSGFEDIQRRVPDITKIKLEIGWEPNQTLAEIIKDIVKNLT